MNVSLIFLLGLLTVIAAAKSKSDKLQIGVKKRVENCDLKSKKGDRLHMHYTVRTHLLH